MGKELNILFFILIYDRKPFLLCPRVTHLNVQKKKNMVYVAACLLPYYSFWD